MARRVAPEDASSIAAAGVAHDAESIRALGGPVDGGIAGHACGAGDADRALAPHAMARRVAPEDASSIAAAGVAHDAESIRALVGPVDGAIAGHVCGAGDADRAVAANTMAPGGNPVNPKPGADAPGEDTAEVVLIDTVACKQGRTRLDFEDVFAHKIHKVIGSEVVRGRH